MLSNCVYIGNEPKTNIMPKILSVIIECAMADEEYCTFAMMLDEKIGIKEKYVENMCEKLEDQGCEATVYYLTDTYKNEMVQMAYIRVK